MTHRRPTRNAGIALAALASVVVGTASASQPEADPHADLVKVAVVSEMTGVAPGGTVWVGVEFHIKPGWHTYWPGQNDSGLGTQIEPNVPEGFTVGAIRWPAPHRHLAPGDILDHIHEGSVTALLPVRAPADAPIGTVSQLSFDLAWLVCEEVCIPGWETVTLSIPIVASPEPSTGATAERFARTRERVPGALTENSGVSITWSGKTAVVRASDAKKMSFYPDEGGSSVVDLSTSGVSSGGELRLTFDTPEPVLSGVLEILGSGGASRLFVVRSVRDAED